LLRFIFINLVVAAALFFRPSLPLRGVQSACQSGYFRVHGPRSMKGVFHLAGFNYGLSGDGEWRLPVQLPTPGSTFAASLHSSRFINLDAYYPLLRHSWLVAR